MKVTTGMFLYAKLVLTNLHSQTTKSRLHNELEPNIFPEGLEQAWVNLRLRHTLSLMTNFPIPDLGTNV
jgi:hypothetical protein